MISNVEIRAPDLKKIKKTIKGLDNQLPVLLTRAINRAATTAKTSIGKTKTGVPSIYETKSKDVKPSTKLLSQADKSNLVAVVEVKGRPRPLAKFKISPRRLSKRKGKKGSPKLYKASVIKEGGLKDLSGAPNKPFYAVTKKRVEGIFSRTDTLIQKRIKIVRRSKKSAKVKLYNYKTKVNALQMHYGPSIPQMVNNEKIMTKVQADANKTLQSRLDHEVTRYLERLEK